MATTPAATWRPRTTAAAASSPAGAVWVQEPMKPGHRQAGHRHPASAPYSRARGGRPAPAPDRCWQTRARAMIFYRQPARIGAPGDLRLESPQSSQHLAIERRILRRSRGCGQCASRASTAGLGVPGAARRSRRRCCFVGATKPAARPHLDRKIAEREPLRSHRPHRRPHIPPHGAPHPPQCELRDEAQRHVLAVTWGPSLPSSECACAWAASFAITWAFARICSSRSYRSRSKRPQAPTVRHGCGHRMGGAGRPMPSSGAHNMGNALLSGSSMSNSLMPCVRLPSRMARRNGVLCALVVSSRPGWVETYDPAPRR